MPGPLRPIDDRLVYHAIHRGNNRAPVLFDDADFEAFLEAIGDLKKRRPFAFHGNCLMSKLPVPPDPDARYSDRPDHAEPAGLAHPALPSPSPE
jgi:hypothetical protein